MKKIRSIEDNLNRIATALENGALDNISGGGGSSEETWTTVFDDSITTAEGSNPAPMAELALSGQLTADTIRVTFNEQVYECTRQTSPYIHYGTDFTADPVDWVTYPFSVAYNGQDSWFFASESVGTYTVKIEVPESSDDSGSSDFSIANVTIESDISGTCSALIPFIIDAGGLAKAGIYVQSSLVLQASAEPQEYRIPMYKGAANIEIRYSEISGINRVDVTGDIVNNGDEYFDIRGDGHINLKQPTM